MLNPLRKLAFAASLGAGIASFVTVASALPVFDAMAIRNAAPPIVRRFSGVGDGDGALLLQPVWSPARWSAVRSLRHITATARITQDPIMARRLRITAILRQRPAILRQRRAILRRRPAMPCRPERPLETQ
jgi:hypothetical protein